MNRLLSTTPLCLEDDILSCRPFDRPINLFSPFGVWNQALAGSFLKGNNMAQGVSTECGAEPCGNPSLTSLDGDTPLDLTGASCHGLSDRLLVPGLVLVQA
jgi:hypothetical protein